MRQKKASRAYSQCDGPVGEGVRGHLMELHVAAHHFPVGRKALPTAPRAFIIWFTLRWYSRAAAAAEQQNHKQLQQIHPHFHTPAQTGSSIDKTSNLLILNKADGQQKHSMFAMRRRPGVHRLLKTHLPLLAQLSLPPPLLVRLSRSSAVLEPTGVSSFVCQSSHL